MSDTLNEEQSNILSARKKELEEQLAQKTTHLEQVIREQEESARLLIRRDLALNRANEKLQAFDVAKSEFISIAAHQLRTPLSAIKWILNMAVNNEFSSPQETLQFLGKAYESTERMIGLVNDLLEVDHLQSGKDHYTFVAVDVEPILQSILFDTKTMAEKRKLKVKLNLEPQSILNGDAEKIRAVFQNLIENAIKYTLLDGEIQITSKHVNNEVLLTVADNGIGIPVEQQPTVFTKFFRAKNALKVDTSGSGLGLFIVRQIVERHGGKIWFESAVGKGSTFFILLPAGDLLAKKKIN